MGMRFYTFSDFLFIIALIYDDLLKDLLKNYMVKSPHF